MDKRIREAIEACRPGSTDLQHDLQQADVQPAPLDDLAQRVESDPAVRAVYERVQKRDAAIRDAMEQVNVPSGLAGRILERLQAETSSRAESSAQADASSRVAIPALADAVSVDAAGALAGVQVAPATPSRTRSMGQRSFGEWSLLAAAVAASLLVAVLIGQWFKPVADDPLEVLADRWSQEIDQRGGAWQDMKQAPRDLAIPPAIVATATGWQAIGKSASGIAYRLADARGVAGMLYVVRLSQTNAPLAPPVAPQSTTGGKAVGYWRQGQLVYVLVVPDEPSYRRFVRASNSPLA